MKQISLAVADGQRTFADALAARLAAEDGLRVVAAVGSVAAMRTVLAGQHVDVVLLDGELPAGLNLASELSRFRPANSGTARVIMLGPVPDPARIAGAVRAGIAGWVPKDESVEHLIDVIRGVMRGEARLPAMAVRGVLQLLLHEHGQQEGSPGHPLARLTPREREVLSYLVRGAGRREVAERMHLSANTVRTHLQNLMGKLKVHSSLEAVAIARRAGLPPAPLQTPRTLVPVSEPG
jgi:DNA-binding NarL/FixJ family response regulator